MEVARCEVRAHGAGTYGHAILSRWPIVSCEEHDLSVAGREPRRALRADVRIEGDVVRVFACHFGLGPRERLRQIEALAAFVRAAPKPRVVMGDFNEWHAGPVARVLRAELSGGAAIARTHPAPLPILPLDRIFWDDALTGHARVHRAHPAPFASDHLPMVATLWRTTGSKSISVCATTFT